MGGWIAGVFFAVLIVILLGMSFGSMNDKYNQSYELEGLATQETLDKLVDYQNTVDNELKEGEAGFTDEGISLSSSWSILSSVRTIVWSFVTGGWILTLVYYMGLPLIVGTIFRTLYFMSVVFIILKILFKIKV